MITIETNANQLAAKYQRRVAALAKFSKKTHEFAIALHALRKANLQKLIYNKSPYVGTKNAPRGDLMQGERVQGEMVFNVSPHAETRRKMSGPYVISPGMSKSADWERQSFLEILPVVRRQELMISRSVLGG